jgi:NADH-quinone oxidoreductase subunit A
MHSGCAILPTDRTSRSATPLFVSIFPLPEASNLNGDEPALWPFVVYFIAVLLLVATMLGLSWVLGQRRANHATNLPFESGVLSVGSPQIHMSVEFYLVAIFFVIFDLETVFIFAWAVAFFELGWEGFIAVGVFIAILAVALVYELSTGALDWGIKTRSGIPDELPHPEEAL